MTSPAAWGDVPSWIQALGGVAQLGHAIWAVQKHRGFEYGQFLRQKAALEDHELADLARDDEALAGLVFQGLEAAMRASSEDKRRLLAVVVADGFRPDGARIDELEVLLRTASALEPLHVRVLAEIAQPRPDHFSHVEMVGAIRERDLAQRLEGGQQGLVKPIVQALQGQGLVVDEGAGTVDYAPTWFPSVYGFRFLEYLGQPDQVASTLVPVHMRTRLLVKNLGPRTVTLIELGMTTDGDSLLAEPSLPVVLVAGDRVTFPCNDLVPENGVAVMTLAWTTPEGRRVESTRRQPRRR